VPNADGSIDIYIQNTPPAGHESNWLPRRQAIAYSGCASMSLAQLFSTARTRYRP